VLPSENVHPLERWQLSVLWLQVPPPLLGVYVVDPALIANVLSASGGQVEPEGSDQAVMGHVPPKPPQNEASLDEDEHATAASTAATGASVTRRSGLTATPAN
jgi:hypothetical protein